MYVDAMLHGDFLEFRPRWKTQRAHGGRFVGVHAVTVFLHRQRECRRRGDNHRAPPRNQRGYSQKRRKNRRVGRWYEMHDRIAGRGRERESDMPISTCTRNLRARSGPLEGFFRQRLPRGIPDWQRRGCARPWRRTLARNMLGMESGYYAFLRFSYPAHSREIKTKIIDIQRT